MQTRKESLPRREPGRETPTQEFEGFDYEKTERLDFADFVIKGIENLHNFLLSERKKEEGEEKKTISH